MRKIAAVSLFLLTVTGVAQNPPLPATFIPNSDIQSFIDALPRNAVSDKPIRSVDVGGYHVAVFGVFRPKSVAQEANRHDTKVTEIYYILDGNATLVTGGQLVSPTRNGDNLTGTAIQGGTSQKMSKGDFMLIPQGVPHWITNVQGSFTPMTLHLPMTSQDAKSGQ